MGRFLSTAGHEKSRGKQGGPSPKAKYYIATDSELVPRGKGEKNPGKGSEIDLKPYAYKESERVFISVMACLLKNEPTS